MTGFDILSLISETYTVGELGQRIPKKTRRNVFCRAESISQTEFFAAGRIGLTPAYKMVLSTELDYGGEEIAEFEGKRYAVYRTYTPASGGIELYLKRETGVQ